MIVNAITFARNKSHISYGTAKINNKSSKTSETVINDLCAVLYEMYRQQEKQVGEDGAADE